MASPHAAGAAALLLEYNSLLTPNEIEAILKDTGYDVTDPKNSLIFPIIDIMSALSGDTDYDGIKDDGDNSGIAGDNPCVGGVTTDCDDNCIDTPNLYQDDDDSDGTGNVCDACPSDPPVKIANVSAYYSTFQSAYNNAAEGYTIQSQAGLIIEDVDFNRSISITLDGGYDCSHTSVTGKTTFSGDMIISDGVVTIGDFIKE